MTDQAILDILLAEVKPALGCTGPISVAFAAAAAKDAVGGTPLQVRVLMDKDTYKNSIAVVTPGTPFMGCLLYTSYAIATESVNLLFLSVNMIWNRRQYCSCSRALYNLSLIHIL